MPPWNNTAVRTEPVLRSAPKALSFLWRGALCLFLMVLVLGACSEEKAGKNPEVLRVAVLPDEGREQLLKRHLPLVEYVAEAMGIGYEITVPANYADLVRIFRKGEIDLAFFGAVTFLQADAAVGAQPVAMRDIDASFTSSFLVREESQARGIADLKGERIVFGSRYSTSGHLMPRHYLNAEGITPEEFFDEVTYSGAHDRTVKWVRDGVADVGVANTSIVESMYGSGEISPDQVRVLWKTPPYPDYVWAVSNSLSEAFIRRLEHAFLSLSVINPDHAVILEKSGARGFLPASKSDFARLLEIATRLSLLEPGE